MAIASLLDLVNRFRHVKPVTGSVYDFKMKSLNGQTIDFERFRGKNLLIVNTASHCGFTPQFRQLQELHDRYSPRLEVLGFPANNFLWQEPGSSAEIESFCQVNYGVTFTMFEKISVRGADTHPLYQWLAGQTSKRPSWNFCKYLVDSTGKVKGFFPSKVSPLDKQITDKLS